MNYQRDQDNIRMEDDPRVKGMSELVEKLRRKEIEKQATKKKEQEKHNKMNMIWGKKAKKEMQERQYNQVAEEEEDEPDIYEIDEEEEEEDQNDGQSLKSDSEEMDEDEKREEQLLLQLQEIQRKKQAKKEKKHSSKMKGQYQEEESKLNQLKQVEEYEKKQKKREMEKPVQRKKKEKRSRQLYQDQYATYPGQDEDEDIRHKNHIAQAIENRNTSDILKDLGDPESPRTIGFYFANIICFILVMLIYYGLLIIIMIALGIQLYDFNYNYEEFMEQFNSKAIHPTSAEFKTEGEIQQHHEEVRTFHLGHKHFQLPFDFNNIQLSVWFALIPATFFLYTNLQMLKMDTVEEYIYLKKSNGVRRLNIFKYISYGLTILYMSVVAVNYEVFMAGKSKGTWQNYEGMMVYGLIGVQMTTLYEYSKSKLKDLDSEIESRKTYRQKKY